MQDFNTYKWDVFQRFWNYRRNEFKDQVHYFDNTHREKDGPPVFKSEYKHKNVIFQQGTEEKTKFLIEEGRYHRWFRSMSSSQALTLSVFGNLKVLNRLDLLAGINGDDGTSIFFQGGASLSDCHLEYRVNVLGESRSTSVDVFIKDSHCVAIECKLMEREIGPCSSGKYKKGCDGRYGVGDGKPYKCYKTYRDVKYWKYIPRIFNWSDDKKYDPCPLLDSYQLVRNILSACIVQEGKIDPENGHAVLVYDARNPAFQLGGIGYKIFHEVKCSLKKPSLLQKCSWQMIVKAIKNDANLHWLVSTLDKKYGLHAGS